MSSEIVVTRIDRCLGGGAEESIVKPVKLSDMKRLKDYMTKDENQEGCINNKRELPETCDLCSSSPSSSTLSSRPP
ncbi:hypothetical protein HS088_TW20G00408 [Tripterygium wilfordii]|uniref:Response regulatory domain-containing protein n=1 Tax=Tripterygium wilfordii TaxID=458696 RepID=A0A7J7C7C5_TRIWF|nr:hypothetical protein HS088_TW20G00408 [Tripterygium wilfordii]